MDDFLQKIIKDEIKCYFFLGRDHTPDSKALYEATFAFWKSVLIRALIEHAKETGAHYSDEFLNHEIVCIFHENTPIGLFMFDWFDLDLAAHREHSYFKNYPAFIIDQLRQLFHSRVMSMGNLTIAPEWRKSQIGFGISEILLGLATKRFLASPASALITYTRNDRKTHELVYRHGGIPLLKGHVAHGHDSDVIAVYRTAVTPTPVAGIPALVDLLWQKQYNLVPKGLNALDETEKSLT